MDLKPILDFLSNAYLYGWAGAIVFFVLFVITVRQTTTANDEKKRLEKEKGDLETELSEKESTLEAMKSQINDLEEQLEQKNFKVTELSNEVSSLEKRLAESEEKVKSLETQLENFKRENEEQKDTIQELSGKLSEAEGKVSSLEAELSAKEKELADVREEVGKLGSQLEEVAFKHEIADLYIKLKKLYGEFEEGFTQNILKGIHTMQISDVDLETAQNIFEAAMDSYYKFKEGDGEGSSEDQSVSWEDTSSEEGTVTEE